MQTRISRCLNEMFAFATRVHDGEGAPAVAMGVQDALKLDWRFVRDRSTGGVRPAIHSGVPSVPSARSAKRRNRRRAFPRRSGDV